MGQEYSLEGGSPVISVLRSAVVELQLHSTPDPEMMVIAAVFCRMQHLLQLRCIEMPPKCWPRNSLCWQSDDQKITDTGIRRVDVTGSPAFSSTQIYSLANSEYSFSAYDNEASTK